uniref:Predicted protein n=1 Tax=Hordeum vulgare subsp. vulgare TaxID=112509 RepID=F2E6F0_HORVV|nr:predicted protein [Hordeum vulgare subsp. vulgare]
MVFQVQRSGRKNELMMPVGGLLAQTCCPLAFWKRETMAFQLRQVPAQGLFVAAVKTSLCGVGGSPLKTVPALMFSVVFLLIASRNRGHRLFH